MKCGSLRIFLTFIPLVVLAACGGLSDQEKQLVGKYYNTSLSDTRPVIELNADRTSVRRGIRPGEISYSVGGTWKVDGDSLVILSDSTSITIEEGDPGLVGHVVARKAIPLSGFSENTLSIEQQGITYVYHRRLE